MKPWLKSLLKAGSAFAIPFAAGLGTAMQDGQLTPAELIATAGVALATAATVWAVPYAPSPGRGDR